MNLNVLGPIISFACLVIVLAFTLSIRRSKVVYITDYQTGVRFRKGAFDRILSPGAYFSRGSATQITVLDMRPHYFIFERLFYQDVLRAKSVISVGGEISICNPHLAVSMMKEPIRDALQLVRAHLPSAASRNVADATLDGKKRLAAVITAEVNRELETRGVEIRNLEITELWSQPVKHGIPAVAN